METTWKVIAKIFKGRTVYYFLSCTITLTCTSTLAWRFLWADPLLSPWQSENLWSWSVEFWSWGQTNKRTQRWSPQSNMQGWLPLALTIFRDVTLGTSQKQPPPGGQQGRSSPQNHNMVTALLLKEMYNHRMKGCISKIPLLAFSTTPLLLKSHGCPCYAAKRVQVLQ